MFGKIVKNTYVIALQKADSQGEVSPVRTSVMIEKKVRKMEER